MVETIKQHPIATAGGAAAVAAAGAGLGYAIVQCVRKALASGDEAGEQGQDRPGAEGDDDQEGDIEASAGSDESGQDDEDAGGESDEDEGEDDEEGGEDEPFGGGAEASEDVSDQDDAEGDQEEDEGEARDELGEEDDDAAEDETDEQDEEEEDEAGAEASHEDGGGQGSPRRSFVPAVRNGMSRVGDAAREGYRRGKQLTVENWHAHPLVISVAALAAGAAAAMLLPTSQAEDKLMGKAADRVNDRLRSATGGVLGQGRGVVTRAFEEATSTLAQEAEREGLTPDRLGRKVKRLVSNVRQAVVEAVEQA